VLDAGWSRFRNMLAWKLRLRSGGMLLEVSEHHTTQTCSECGRLPSSSRPRGIAGLGIREWTCDDCGAVHDWDVNAAKNILRCGLTALAEGTSTARLGRPRLQAGPSHPALALTGETVNAAKNILRCGLAALAEGTSTSRLAPVFRPRSHIRATGF
jgi:transposase